MMFFH